MLKEISRLIYKMENLEKLTVEKSKILTKARGKDGHKNMSRKQRENTFTIPSTSIQPPKLASKPKKVYLFYTHLN